MCLLYLVDVHRKPLLSYGLEALCSYCLKTWNMSTGPNLFRGGQRKTDWKRLTKITRWSHPLRGRGCTACILAEFNQTLRKKICKRTLVHPSCGETSKRTLSAAYRYFRSAWYRIVPRQGSEEATTVSCQPSCRPLHVAWCTPARRAVWSQHVMHLPCDVSVSSAAVPAPAADPAPVRKETRRSVRWWLARLHFILDACYYVPAPYRVRLLSSSARLKTFSSSAFVSFPVKGCMRFRQVERRNRKSTPPPWKTKADVDDALVISHTSFTTHT